MGRTPARGGIARVLLEAGGAPLIILALIANVMEGIGKTQIAAGGGRLLDSIIAHNRSGMGGDMLRIVWFVALMAVGIVVKDTLLGAYQERGMVRLRRRTVAAIGRARIDWLQDKHTGELSARASNDLNALGSALRPVLIMGISVLMARLISLGYMFYVNWQLTLIILSLTPVLVALQWVLTKPITKYRAAHLDAMGELNKAVFDALGSFESVKSLSLEGEMAKRFDTAQASQYASAVGENRVVARLTPLNELGRYLPQFFLIGIGGLFVIRGQLSIGAMAMFLALAQSALSILDQVLTLMTDLRKLHVAANRIVELWDVPAEAEGGALQGRGGAEAVIGFRDVAFTYSGREIPAVRGIHFTVAPGEFVALVGESGCGKSTLMKLAAGLYATDAGVRELLGVEYGQWDVGALRQRIAYVTQETWLFSGTLRENIACLNEVPEAQMQRAVDRAGLREFVSRAPDGLNTQVGERGALISGGQRQRIAIARALLRRAEVLMLDEATSALDSHQEREIVDRLIDQEDRPAMLMITHHLANVVRADRILVIRGGEIVESGTHEELMASGGWYARRFLQAQGEVGQ